MSESPFELTRMILSEPTYTFEELQILARDAVSLTREQREIICRGADELLELRRMVVVLNDQLAQCLQKIMAVGDQLTAERRQSAPNIPNYAMSGMAQFTLKWP
jgi:hypothetical protein